MFIIIYVDDRFVQKVHPACANGHWECGLVKMQVIKMKRFHIYKNFINTAAVINFCLDATYCIVWGSK